ncbi:DNA polymerase III subunit delta [Salidesulfovibrio brasiliensis]
MKRPAYSFLVCPDPQLLKARIGEMLAGAGAGTWERRAFWGDDEDPLPDAFWTDLTIKSLFAQPKALIVRRANAFKVDQWDKLGGAITGASPDVWPIFCLEGEWKGKKPAVPAHLAKRDIWKRADKGGWVWQSGGLDKKSMGDFLRRWASDKGISFDKGAEVALAQALPEDAVAAKLELDKIELAVWDEKVVRREHASLVAPTGEMEFFDLMDSLARRGAEAGVWKRVLEDHMKNAKDRMLFNLIGYLASQARQMWMLTHGEENAVRAHPFVKKKLTAKGSQLGEKGIMRLIDLALDAEYSVKTGLRRQEEVLDMLIADLISLFRSGRA